MRSDAAFDSDADDLNLEIDLVLDAIRLKSGYDFDNYSKAHIKRRLMHLYRQRGLERVSELIPLIFSQNEVLTNLLQTLSVNVTEMFRDPDFYRAFREQVIPVLSTYPSITIWHAGCSTGEEAYSMAIMLHEAGLLKRSTIHATDFNPVVLEQASSGIMPLASMKTNAQNYQQSGGDACFSDYYHVRHGIAVFDESLKKSIVFNSHNLVCDEVFVEANVIISRNVLIYFNQTLQNRAIRVFADSLCSYGILCLGIKESLRFSAHGSEFEALNSSMKIFRKCT